MPGADLVGVMIVVPTFATGKDRNEPIVAAVVAGLVVPISPPVRRRINGPGRMPNFDRADKHSPNQDAAAKLNSSHHVIRH